LISIFDIHFYHLHICADANNPEYKLIVNEDKNIKISLDELIEENCLRNIDNAIHRAMPITKYLDSVFEKRLTTIHPRRKPDAVNIEFIEVSEN
jgi:hypothetical protein